MDFQPFVINLKDNYFKFIKKWQDWKKKDQSEKDRGNRWQFWEWVKKLTLVLLLLKLWAFGSNIFQKFNFYPKLHFLYFLVFSLIYERESCRISLIEKERLSWHRFWPQNRLILVSMDSIWWGEFIIDFFTLHFA